jgi:hypothetical protein
MIKLELQESEVKAILSVLGQLPTNTGAYPLLLNIEGQLQAQIEEPAKPAEE